MSWIIGSFMLIDVYKRQGVAFARIRSTFLETKSVMIVEHVDVYKRQESKV